MSRDRRPLTGRELARLAVRATLCASASAVLAACGSLSPREFSAGQPAFAPERYFEGKTKSRGMFETRSGQPRQTFTTRAMGRREGDTLVLHQQFTYGDGKTQARLWSIHRLDADRYEATANDVVGTARGEAFGPLFHWRYTVALQPGNPLSHVALEQWMFLQPDRRTVLNRAVIRKWGVRVGMVTELFEKQ